MGIIRKMRSMFHEDWCNLCQHEMDMSHKQLYAMPDMMVGHYSSHESPAYYQSHLVPVAKKAEIPPGMYACGLHAYYCPQCGNRRTKLTVFLPVRNQEKIEEVLFFDHGELDPLTLQSGDASAAFQQGSAGHRQDSVICSHRDPYGY